MRTERLDEGVFRTEAANGLVVLTEAMPSLRSAGAAFWIRTASAHEAPQQMGVSHLLEHMVFKGTQQRTAHDLAMALESRGGSLDAYTGRDQTTFQARVLDADLPVAFDVLDDLVRRPALRDEDLVRERMVVLEEIATVDDTPDDLVFDLHSNALWPDHSYGYRILGTRETVEGLTGADVRGLHSSAYHPRRTVFTAAGNVDHDRVLGMLREAGWFDLGSGPEWRHVDEPGRFWSGERRIGRDSAQVRLVMGTATFPYADRRRHALTLISSALGGGMSSRLFQRVREELALAYTVYTYNAFHRRSGMCGTFVGTQPPTAQQAIDVLREEYARMAGSALGADELAAAKQQVKGQAVLALESPMARMYRLAGLALHDEPYRSLDSVLADIEAVTQDEVAAVAAEFFDPGRQAVIWLGPH